MKRVKSFQLILFVWWLFMLSIFTLFLWKNINYMLDSDMSSELVLARLLAEENRILSSNWFYSTELRVLNTQLIFGLLFKFTSDWHFVRVAGSVLLILIMTVSLYYLLRQMGCSKYFFIGASFLITPWSTEYFKYVLKGVYYVPHIAISFFTLGMVLNFAKTQKKSTKCFLLTMLAGLSFLAGMGGPRQMIVLYIPLLLAALLWLVQSRKNAGNSPHIMRCYFTPVCLAFAAATVGYAVNIAVLSKQYTFSSWKALSYRDFSLDSLTAVVNGFLHSYGYSENLVFSSATIQNAFAVVVFMLVVFCTYTVAKKKTDGSETLKTLSLFYLSACVVFAALYTFTDMAYRDRYNLPIIIFSIPIGILGVKELVSDKRVQYLFGILLIVTATFGGCMRYKNWGTGDSTKELRQVSGYLVEQECFEGYATFWNANVLTELSNGKIEMWDWMDSSEGELESPTAINRWLQVKAHETEKPQGRMFTLFTKSELENCPIKMCFEEQKIAFTTKNYIVFCFESYEELERILQSAEL